VQQHLFRSRGALVVLKRRDGERFHVVTGRALVLRERPDRRLRELDYWDRISVGRLVDLRESFGESVGLDALPAAALWRRIAKSSPSRIAGRLMVVALTWGVLPALRYVLRGWLRGKSVGTEP
jgi:hypothetical protein